MIRIKRRDTTVTDLRPFGLTTGGLTTGGPVVEPRDRLIETLPARDGIGTEGTSEGASGTGTGTGTASDGQPLGDDHVKTVGCWLNVGPHAVPAVVQRVGGHPKDLQNRPYGHSDNLFDGISEQRKRRLLGIRIGGKPLFDRNGKCAL